MPDIQPEVEEEISPEILPDIEPEVQPEIEQSPEEEIRPEIEEPEEEIQPEDEFKDEFKIEPNIQVPGGDISEAGIDLNSEEETEPEIKSEPEQEIKFEPEFNFEQEINEPEAEDMVEAMTDINNSDEAEDLQDMEEDIENINAAEEPADNAAEQEFAPWLAAEEESSWSPNIEPENLEENFENNNNAIIANNLNAGGEAAQREKDMGLRERMLARKNGAADSAQNGAQPAAKSGGGWKGRAIMAFLLFLLVIGAGMCWWELHKLNLNNSGGESSGANSETAMKIQNLLNNLENQNKEIKTYEYAIDFLVDSNITAGMAARGANGWQVVGSRRSQDTSTGQYGYEFIFMRPVTAR